MMSQPGIWTLNLSFTGLRGEIVFSVMDIERNLIQQQRSKLINKHIHAKDWAREEKSGDMKNGGEVARGNCHIWHAKCLIYTM